MGKDLFNLSQFIGKILNMKPEEKFELESKENICGLGTDQNVHDLSKKWVIGVSPYKWSYNFKWMGRPAIQFPNDTFAMQELIWQIKPDLIIETGIAHGGSLVFSASMLALLDICEALEKGDAIDPSSSKRKVLGIDIDIRAHNRKAIEDHPLSSFINMIEGSSISTETIDEVHEFARNYKKIIVCLDSNHTHEHVLSELNAFAHLIPVGSYCVVFDTLIDDMPDELSIDRPWGKGNNPKTAVREFIKNNEQFIIDESIHEKLQITVAPHGFLKKIKQ